MLALNTNQSILCEILVYLEQTHIVLHTTTEILLSDQILAQSKILQNVPAKRGHPYDKATCLLPRETIVDTIFYLKCYFYHFIYNFCTYGYHTYIYTYYSFVKFLF